jgi:hypothetical protein
MFAADASRAEVCTALGAASVMAGVLVLLPKQWSAAAQGERSSCADPG